MDLVRRICGAHRGYEAAEVRDIRRNGGEHRLRGGSGKVVYGVFPGRSRSCYYKIELVQDAKLKMARIHFRYLSYMSESFPYLGCTTDNYTIH